MIKVFIGGSRRVSQLDKQVRGRLDEIIRKQLPVIIGDANGADKAVQDYFRTCGYDQVEVFCTEGRCRNNMGNQFPFISSRIFFANFSIFSMRFMPSRDKVPTFGLSSSSRS